MFSGLGPTNVVGFLSAQIVAHINLADVLLQSGLTRQAPVRRGLVLRQSATGA